MPKKQIALSNMSLLLLSIVHATHWLRKDKRKITGFPAIIHALHVMLIILEHGVNIGDKKGIEALIVAALHDCHERNPKEATFKIIEKLFGKEIVNAVKNLTLDQKNPDKIVARSKIIMSDCWVSKIVKLADVLSKTQERLDQINTHNFAWVQRHFKSIPERIKMERWFVKAVCSFDDEACLVALQKSTLQALDELESVISQTSTKNRRYRRSVFEY